MTRTSKTAEYRIDAVGPVALRRRHGAEGRTRSGAASRAGEPQSGAAAVHMSKRCPHCGHSLSRRDRIVLLLSGATLTTVEIMKELRVVDTPQNQAIMARDLLALLRQRRLRRARGNGIGDVWAWSRA